MRKKRGNGVESLWGEGQVERNRNRGAGKGERRS